MPSTAPSLNEQIAPDSICWACGPTRSDGLGLRYIPGENGVTAEWLGDRFYEGAPGRLHNGLLAALLEEVSGWAAIQELVRVRGGLEVLRIRTLDVRYEDIGPSGEKVVLDAVAESLEGDVVTTSATLRVRGAVIATATAELCAC